jgi:homoserine dehydrogenase
VSGNYAFVVDRDAAGAANSAQRPLQVALLGFGTVGRSVARILIERPELGGRLQLTHVFNRDVSRKRADWVPESVTWTEDLDELFASEPDVIVEVVGGVRPAGDWVRRALERGISVVTANKMLLAAEGPALLHLAASAGAQIRFEAAVGGGVPLVQGVREGLAGDTLTRVIGILNGTSNYVLSRMEAGVESIDAVLDEARRLGYAEADPSADIDGDDAAAKLVVLAGIAFGRHLPLARVPRRSIRPIGAADFRYASRLGCTIRQIALVEAAADGTDALHAFVGPTLVPADSSFGRNDGADNIVTLRGQYGGSSSFSGAGAGGPATAVAVVSDLLALAERRTPGSNRPPVGTPGPFGPGIETGPGVGQSASGAWEAGTLVATWKSAYYLRFVVRDKPGILASIASALAREGINLDAVLQDPGYPKDALVFVVTVEPCEEFALNSAIRAIAGAEYHSEPPLALPMLLGV